jgi:hypothetical protein
MGDIQRNSDRDRELRAQAADNRRRAKQPAGPERRGSLLTGCLIVLLIPLVLAVIVLYLSK